MVKDHDKHGNFTLIAIPVISRSLRLSGGEGSELSKDHGETRDRGGPSFVSGIQKNRRRNFRWKAIKPPEPPSKENSRVEAE